MLGIKYVSYLGDGGYATAAKAYILALVKRGVPLTWAPIELGSYGDLGWRPFTGRSTGDKDLDPYLYRDMNYDVVLLHLPPEKYPWWMEQEKGKIFIGYTVWETSKIKPFWVGPINLLNGLLVPSEWNKAVFEEGNVTTNITVVPHLLNHKLAERETGDKTKKECVFYSIGEWTERKAISKLIDAYLTAFTKYDRTCLLIKTNKIGSGEPIRPHILEKIFHNTKYMTSRMRQKYDDPAKITIINKRLDEEGIMGLHKHGSCYVSLTRSEGWGLGAYDAATAGKPVLITGYGGQMDYLDSDLTYFVNFQLTDVEYAWRGEDFHPAQKWAEPDIQHAARLLKEIYENQSEASERGRKLKQHVIQKFSEQRIMDKFLEAIMRAVHENPGPAGPPAKQYF